MEPGPSPLPRENAASTRSPDRRPVCPGHGAPVGVRLAVPERGQPGYKPARYLETVAVPSK